MIFTTRILEKLLISIGIQLILVFSTGNHASAQPLRDKKPLFGQEEGPTLPEAETATQSTRSFMKISLKPEFPYADGWLGGDGALSVQLSDTKVLWIFSDTYVSDNPNAGKRKRSSDMVANTIAISTFTDNQVHTQYFWRKLEGKHGPFFEPDTSSYKFWPGWAFYLYTESADH